MFFVFDVKEKMAVLTGRSFFSENLQNCIKNRLEQKGVFGKKEMTIKHRLQADCQPLKEKIFWYFIHM